MIKGINRQMIEITDTGSPYFERALLVVQSDLADISHDTLQSAAHTLMTSAGDCSQLRRQRARLLLREIALSILGAILGAAVTLVVVWMV